MFSYSTSVMLTWQISVVETCQARHPFIEKEQLMIGLLKVGDVLDEDVRSKSNLEISATDLEILEKEITPIDETFNKLRVNRIELRRTIRGLAGKGNHVHREKIVHRSDKSRLCFKRAEEIAQRGQALTLKPIHLLVALMEEPTEIITEALKQMGVNPDAVRDTCIPIKEKEPIPTEHRKTLTGKEIGGDLLTNFGIDLTELAKEGKIEPLIGRHKEILQIIRTLSRKTKNNPMLIGDAGVGKTAIVRGLALKIAQEDIPPTLRNKRIIEINMGALVAGTKYRGEFENKIIKMLDICSRSEDIILFIDEIHTLVGAGKAEGALDAADIIKPALSKGEIICIGSTTMEEYRKYIEKDTALERRFQPIMIEEPTELETIEILKGLKNSFENHHRVVISPSVIEAAVRLSIRYIPDRHLPDKAIDTIDEACTRFKVNISNYSDNLEQNQSAIGEVTEEMVAEVIADWSGCPTEKLSLNDSDRLSIMESELKKRVIGQDEAVTRLVQLIKMSRTGLRDPQKPIGVFLFLGPTGVGKTELAKALSAFLFDSEDEMIRLDMSEYMEKHSVAKLIGSPPGYVGYEEEGQLTEKLRRRPYSVVLLDEIEKAHPEVLDMFLQLFDEGRITDSKGRTINARNSIFIMTSNIGTDYTRKITPGFERQEEGEISEKFKSHLKKRLKPEFINRIDEIVTFGNLNLKVVEIIATVMIERLKTRLTNQGIELEVSNEAMAYIAHKGYDPIFGVRPLARMIDEVIGIPLSEMIINKDLTKNSKVIIGISDNKIVFARSG